MACARHLGLTDLPIVCVNVENYYAPFAAMLDRAYKDELIKLKPNEIVHFASTSLDAVRWIEEQKEKLAARKRDIARRSSVLKRSSFISYLPGGDYFFSEDKNWWTFEFSKVQLSLVFAAGLALGAATGMASSRR